MNDKQKFIWFKKYLIKCRDFWRESLERGIPTETTNFTDASAKYHILDALVAVMNELDKEQL